MKRLLSLDYHNILLNLDFGKLLDLKTLKKVLEFTKIKIKNCLKFFEKY